MGLSLQHATDRRLSPGKHYPLGATLTDEGVNFAIYSRSAVEIFLQLFDAPDGQPTDTIRLECRTQSVRHVVVHGAGAGQLYGYRVRGDRNPAVGFRFNESKLLIDPYAKALTGKARNRDGILQAYDIRSPLKDLSIDGRDSAGNVPRSVVIDDRFDWQGDAPPETPFERLVIYEVHLKGFTADPSSGVRHPGTYLGFIEKIPHLKSLGINAVELLPIHEFYVDDFLLDRGLTNYWGYNTIGFFAPESTYGTGRSPASQVDEFKTLVRELHKAGIEVILDVVYNHTGEGNEMGPTLSFRGIDNPTYYCLTGPPREAGRYYMNYSGCGNALNLGSPAVIRLVMDSLRYWTEVMHVDGFRFDLASVLGRGGGPFRNSASFFDAISQDPVLHRVKLIAEPWDLGTYEVGNFPVDWSEWNGRFRDTVRRFIKGDAGQVADLGWRLTGSADLYGDDGRSAYNSVNFVTCHDGFTLNDLFSYNEKHNEANGENNADGANNNDSWNCGAEGPTREAEIATLRRRLAKNAAALLLFSAGTPMILGGDEFLRTQRGNNNAYCQDNALSWFDWDLAVKNADMVDYFRKVIGLTGRFPILTRRSFLLGQDLDADGLPDISWLGTDLGRPSWNDPENRTLCCLLDGGETLSPEGKYLLFLVLNGDWRAQTIRLPVPRGGIGWRRVLDTSLSTGQEIADAGQEVLIDPPGFYLASPRSVVLLLSR
jgi:isoamylase